MAAARSYAITRLDLNPSWRKAGGHVISGHRGNGRDATSELEEPQDRIRPKNYNNGQDCLRFPPMLGIFKRPHATIFQLLNVALVKRVFVRNLHGHLERKGEPPSRDHLQIRIAEPIGRGGNFSLPGIPYRLAQPSFGVCRLYRLFAK